MDDIIRNTGNKKKIIINEENLQRGKCSLERDKNAQFILSPKGIFSKRC